MDRVAIDFETKRMGKVPNPHVDPLLLTGISFPDGREFIFEKNSVPEWVGQMIADPTITKLSHNLSFEQMFARHNFGVDFANAHDTLAAERLLTSGKGLSAGLKATAKRRLGVELDKGVRDNFAFGRMTNEEKEYCLQDCRVLFQIDSQQREELRSNGQLVAADIEDKIGVVTGTMQHVGIGFDLTLWDKFVPIMKREAESARKIVWDGIGCHYSHSLFSGYSGGISLTSRDKILAALAEVGIKLDSYSSSDLEKFIIKNAKESDTKKREIVKAILDFKKWDKARGWAYPKFITNQTGRIHASMNAQGADTFRYTASEPNLMQVTKPFGEINFRHLFYAGKGRKIVGADYSQMELRNIAEVTDDPLLLNAFNTGADMHVLMAEKVLGRELKKGERNLGKAVNFGVRSYGGSKNALIRSALMYGILLTEEEANKYVQEIRKASQEIQNWGIRITKQAERDGYLQTPIGHRRYFEEVRETQTRNTVIQTFSAGIMKQALVEIYRILKQDFTDAWIVLQVYDEVVVDCKEEDAEAIKEIIEREMVSAATSWMHKVPVIAEGYISNSWEK